MPLLCLQHFTGTLDNWDPAVTDPLAADHDIILFDNAGVGGSTGKVPTTMAAMAEHVFAFLNTLRIDSCDVLGFSLGSVIAQQMALDNPRVFRKMILVGRAPRGGEDIMHLEKPSLAKPIHDPTLQRGKTAGELRSDTEPDLLNDAIFGAIYYRFLLGLSPFSKRFGEKLVEQAIRGNRLGNPRS